MMEETCVMSITVIDKSNHCRKLLVKNKIIQMQNTYLYIYISLASHVNTRSQISVQKTVHALKMVAGFSACPSEEHDLLYQVTFKVISTVSIYSLQIKCN